jgi:endo-1,3-1,4-beta-glycanase ExoK
MKPSGQSGTSSSFYAFSGFYDSAAPRTESNSGDPHFHNELDIEFVGKNTSQVQTNYYARHSYRQDPNVVGTGSGVESLHDLGFDAAGRFHPYTIRWTQAGIEWFAGDRLLRKVRREDDPNMPDPAFGPLRISANVWVADGAARGWTGELADGFYGAKSEYAWMKFTPGEACAPEPDCGFHQNGVDDTGTAGGIR